MSILHPFTIFKWFIYIYIYIYIIYIYIYIYIYTLKSITFDNVYKLDYVPYRCRMWDMSALIWRCEIFRLFYSFCSLLVVDAESQTRDQDVGRHVDVRTITFLEGLLLWRRSY